jgi:NAD+ synthase (glutamine-hydrolysing)
VRGDRLPVVRLHGVDVAPVVCEDLWQPGGPLQVARAAGAGLVVCINGSPYERGKDDVRGPLASRRAVEAGAAVVYVNCVGGQDERSSTATRSWWTPTASWSPARRCGRRG